MTGPDEIFEVCSIDTFVTIAVLDLFKFVFKDCVKMISKASMLE